MNTKVAQKVAETKTRSAEVDSCVLGQSEMGVYHVFGKELVRMSAGLSAAIADRVASDANLPPHMRNKWLLMVEAPHPWACGPRDWLELSLTELQCALRAVNELGAYGDHAGDSSDQRFLDEFRVQLVAAISNKTDSTH